MKKISSLILIVFAITVACGAQQNPTCGCFEAEGKLFYRVAGVPPGSLLEFYSTRGGHRMIKETSANADGAITLPGNEHFKPAFALSRATRKVYYCDQKEFIIDNLNLAGGKDELLVEWVAALSKPELISFEVTKSRDGLNYMPVGTIDGTSEARAHYSLNDKVEPGSWSYRIKLRNKSTKETIYASKLISFSTSPVKVYPTVASNLLTVEASNFDNLSYMIIGVDGRTASAGVLQKGLNSINISDLVVGNYQIVVHEQGQKYATAKFSKFQ